jgi:putative DNA primase/helicase
MAKARIAQTPPSATYPAVPRYLKDRQQWVVWKYVDREGKQTKCPHNARTGNLASSNNPSDWSGIEIAETALSGGNYNGIGYVFSEDDGLVGIDIDDCRNAQTGEVEPWALEMILPLTGYWEVSPSGTGIKGFIIADKPPTGRRKKVNGGEVEIYGKDRYFTVTGDVLSNISINFDNCSPALEQLRERLGVNGQEMVRAGHGWVERETDPRTDEEVLKQARDAWNGDKFKRIYDDADMSGYSSNSELDMACLTMLAFWTDGGHDQMERLMHGSALARPKWDDKRNGTTWLREQIISACDFVTANKEENLSKRFKNPDTFAKKSSGAGAELRPSEAPAMEATDAEIFMRTDLGNAERFSAQHGKNVRYVAQTGKWMMWDGVRWKPDDMDAVYQLAKETVRSIYAEAAQIADADLREKMGKWAANSESLFRVKAMITLAAKVPCITAKLDQFDTNPWLLGCLNGTLDLKTGKLREAQREDYITKQALVHAEPTAKCPVWTKTLEKLQPDLVMRNYLQRALGYTLSGVTTEQCFYFLYGMGTKTNGEAGNGANGKSTVIETFLELMGDYALKARIESFLQARQGSSGPTPEIYKFRGRRLIVGSEVGMGVQLDTAFIKDITGNDRISARTHYQEPVEFRPDCKIWLYGNYKPGIKGSDEGTWRRPRLIEFPTYIEPEERDKALGEKLKAELPGILNWAVTGCLAWQQEGMNDPARVLNSVKDYRAEMDVIGTFLAECCEPGVGKQISGKELYSAYTDWCEESGAFKNTKNYLTLRIQERGFKKTIKDGYPIWHDMALRPWEDRRSAGGVSVNTGKLTFHTQTADQQKPAESEASSTNLSVEATDHSRKVNVKQASETSIQKAADTNEGATIS